MDETTHCGRCGIEVSVNDAEVCWYCTGYLCGNCWETYGQCGHAEAVKFEEMAKAVPQPANWICINCSAPNPPINTICWNCNSHPSTNSFVKDVDKWLR